MTDSSEALRYPIGRFVRPSSPTPAARRQWVRDLRHLPLILGEALDGLEDNQLDTPYRPDGWTLRQVAHHVADSHINGYIRTKWTLTEESPPIKTYHQRNWAELPDATALAPSVSLALLGALHHRWVDLLGALHENDWRRAFVHPESGSQTLDDLVALYAWHGRHHTAHIRGLCDRNGW